MESTGASSPLQSWSQVDPKAYRVTMARDGSSLVGTSSLKYALQCVTGRTEPSSLFRSEAKSENFDAVYGSENRAVLNKLRADVSRFFGPKRQILSKAATTWLANLEENPEAAPQTGNDALQQTGTNVFHLSGGDVQTIVANSKALNEAFEGAIRQIQESEGISEALARRLASEMPDALFFEALKDFSYDRKLSADDRRKIETNLTDALELQFLRLEEGFAAANAADLLLTYTPLDKSSPERTPKPANLIETGDGLYQSLKSSPEKRLAHLRGLEKQLYTAQTKLSDTRRSLLRTIRTRGLTGIPAEDPYIRRIDERIQELSGKLRKVGLSIRIEADPAIRVLAPLVGNETIHPGTAREQAAEILHPYKEKAKRLGIEATKELFGTTTSVAAVRKLSGIIDDLHDPKVWHDLDRLKQMKADLDPLFSFNWERMEVRNKLLRLIDQRIPTVEADDIVERLDRYKGWMNSGLKIASKKQAIGYIHSIVRQVEKLDWLVQEGKIPKDHPKYATYIQASLDAKATFRKIRAQVELFDQATRGMAQGFRNVGDALSKLANP